MKVTQIVDVPTRIPIARRALPHERGSPIPSVRTRQNGTSGCSKAAQGMQHANWKLFSLHGISARPIAQAMFQLFSRVESPKKIITDRGLVSCP